MRRLFPDDVAPKRNNCIYLTTSPEGGADVLGHFTKEYLLELGEHIKVVPPEPGAFAHSFFLTLLETAKVEKGVTE
mgnify:CR=1 FL=1